MFGLEIFGFSGVHWQFVGCPQHLVEGELYHVGLSSGISAYPGLRCLSVCLKPFAHLEEINPELST